MECLIIEDDRTNSAIIQEQIRTLGIKTYVSNNGIEGLEKYQEIIPELIVLDMYMPEMNGMEFLIELNKQEIGHKPYIIICSNKATEADIESALKCGADAALTKPFSIDAFKKLLEDKGLILENKTT